MSHFNARLTVGVIMVFCLLWVPTSRMASIASGCTTWLMYGNAYRFFVFGFCIHGIEKLWEQYNNEDSIMYPACVFVHINS